MTQSALSTTQATCIATSFSPKNQRSQHLLSSVLCHIFLPKILQSRRNHEFRKNPCLGCRQGSWDLTSRRFQLHFRRYCTKSFLKQPALATRAKRSHITFDNHSNPTVPRNTLMTSDTLTSHAVSENTFESGGSPPDPAPPPRNTSYCAL